MFFGNRRTNYSVIDDNDYTNTAQEADGIDELTPPHHEIISVSFENFQKEKTAKKPKQDHRWDHIENVDQFFTLVYEYHQGNGFTCIALRQAFALFQFIFVICFSTFILQCVDYDVLFNNRNTNTQGDAIMGKRHISDAIICRCASNLNLLVVLALILATCFCLWQFVCISYHLLQLREIKVFYATALELQDADLANITWQHVVNKLCKLQPKLHLIINQQNITPLDVYQRILRFKNYFVALIYEELLPSRLFFPFLGPTPFFSSGLRLNLEWLFFWGPWAPWKNSYALKDEYKDPANIQLLAQRMRKTIVWLSLANLILFPFVLIYQILFNFFSYADSIKREPSFFGTRKYANYGREKLRHFNELDHELHSRLNQSYSFSVRYMDQFLSPTVEIVSKTIAFIAGSIFAVFFILSAWDEDVLNIEHVLTIMTVCGGAIVICRSFIPSENMVYCQDFLMRQIISRIHYAPKSWLKEAHSTEVYHEFSQLFQLKAYTLLEELLSPIITPFVLYFYILPLSPELVMFFHNKTRFVDGLGDVCSYALMDISVDGDRRLSSLNESIILNPFNSSKNKNLKRMPAFCGKIELSLINFATLNPDWTPSPVSFDFIQRVKDIVTEDIAHNPEAASLQNSLMQMESSTKNKNNANLAFCINSSSTAQKLSNLANNHRRGSKAHSNNSVLNLSSANNLPLNSENEAGPNDATSTSMIASLSNKNSFMTSFAHQYPPPLTSMLQPRHIQENSARALEMSFNALALNQMLASNQMFHLTTFNQSCFDPSTNNLVTLRRYVSGEYGAINASQFRNNLPTNASAYASVTASRYGVGGGGFAGSATASNMWGVPELSQALLNEDDEEDELRALSIL